MKTVLLKTTFIAVIIIFALTFVTCAPELLPEGVEGVEYTDVEYEIYGGVGNERVKSIKLYLDGKMVPVTAKQRAIQRALSLESAGASHDFFEVVFRNADGSRIARSSWDIGSPARVTNVDRGATTAGLDYRPIYSTSAASSTVFVGKKTNKTLLGVGFMIYVDDMDIAGPPTNFVRNGVESVTFMVAPLRTWLGFDGASTEAVNVRNTEYGYLSTGLPDIGGTNATFITASGDPTNIAPTNLITTGKTASFMKGAIKNPLFTLRAFSGTPANNTIQALYTIGGLKGLTNGTPPPPNANNTGLATTISIPNGGNLWAAVRVYGQRPDRGGGTTTIPRGGMQFIKRKPTFEYQGVKYEAGNIYDAYTSVAIDGGYFSAAAAPASNLQAHLSEFDNSIPLILTVTGETTGLFAITFQCPVVAITDAVTTLDGSKPVKWFVRPADGPNLYLLDDGKADGGMVLLGDDAGAEDDWIQVITTGIGFDND
jgi:hypothetical protein